MIGRSGHHSTEFFKKQRRGSFRPGFCEVVGRRSLAYPAGLSGCCLGWGSNRERAGLAIAGAGSESVRGGGEGWKLQVFEDDRKATTVVSVRDTNGSQNSRELAVEWKRREPSPQGSGPSAIVTDIERVSASPKSDVTYLAKVKLQSIQSRPPTSSEGSRGGVTCWRVVLPVPFSVPRPPFRPPTVGEARGQMAVQWSSRSRGPIAGHRSEPRQNRRRRGRASLAPAVPLTSTSVSQSLSPSLPGARLIAPPSLISNFASKTTLPVHFLLLFPNDRAKSTSSPKPLLIPPIAILQPPYRLL